VTHEKMLVGCEAEFEEFVDRMDILDNKLGPLLFQFPKFSKYVMNADEFLRRLRFFLARVKDLPTVRFAIDSSRPYNQLYLCSFLPPVFKDSSNVAALLRTTSRSTTAFGSNSHG
jgi:uncharacterized protein YecE (DUF72 family)